MKTKSFKFAALLMMMASVFNFTSCDKKGDEPTPTDKTEINALLAECNALLEDATETDFPAEAIEAFTAVVEGAEAALPTATQAQIDNLVVQVTEAKKVFLASAFDAIPEESIIAFWDFNEGEGDELTAQGAKGLKAKLTAGASQIFGESVTKPAFVDGVKGGKALNFQKGAYLAIDGYTDNDLLNKNMTYSAWVKPDSTRAGNYIMSFNRWNNWKLQLQEQNKVFYTIATNTGISDMDNEADNSAPNGDWTHIAVVLSLDNHTVDIYVNGVLTKQWTGETKGPLAGTAQAALAKNPVGFLIGAGVTYEYAVENFTDWDGWKQPSGWDHFVGCMDNVGIYNVALTEGQISKLYNDQK